MQPGEQIGRFEVLRTLGEGGIATVYQVKSRVLDTEHALKLLTVGNPQLAKRLIQEGKIQAKMRHANIVSVTDIVEHQGQVGLVMEFVEGFSLAECLKEEGAMEVDDALPLFGQILAGVGAAHAHGITHRDLKPGNILLTSDGHRVLAKVTDFGIAKVLEGGSADATRQGTAMGTPGYMAPEQIRDSANVDHRADIFALGAILYELLTGRRAFKGNDPLATMNQTVSGSYVPIFDVIDVGLRIGAAVERALLVNPDDRFASCNDFAVALFDEAATIPEVGSRSLPEVSVSTPAFTPTENVADPPSNPTLTPESHTPATMFVDEEEEDEPTEDGFAAATRPPSGPTVFSSSEAPAPTAVGKGNAIFESLRDDPVAPEKAKRLRRVEADRPEPRKPAERTGVLAEVGAKSDDVSILRKTNHLVEPFLTALMLTVKYSFVPVLGFTVVGGYLGNQGAVELSSATHHVETAMATANRAAVEGLSVAQEVAEMSPNPELIRKLAARLESAQSDETKAAVARELYMQLETQLGTLPASDDPATVARRRELQLQVAAVLRKHAAMQKSRESLQQIENKTSAQVARSLGMVD